MSPPYHRDAATGLWGYPTSTMDWCEENYYVTYGIAEFWNTISNVIFIVPPILTIYRSNRQKLLEHRYIFCFFLLMMVGCGSFAFHCTLLYESQLLDELPMLYGTCAMIYCIVEIRGAEGGSNVVTAVILTLVSIMITFGYIVIKNPVFFLWSYGVLATILFILNVRGCLILQGSRKLLACSVVSYMFGFLLWNIDNEMCYTVRDIRNSTPLLFKPMTQLHAWWHFFAGLGTFLCITFSTHLRLCALGYEPSLRVLYHCIPSYIRGGDTGGKEKGLDFNSNFNKQSCYKGLA